MCVCVRTCVCVSVRTSICLYLCMRVCEVTFPLQRLEQSHELGSFLLELRNILERLQRVQAKFEPPRPPAFYSQLVEDLDSLGWERYGGRERVGGGEGYGGRERGPGRWRERGWEEEEEGM